MKTLIKIVSIAQDLSPWDKSFENKQGNMIYMKNETMKTLKKKSVLSFGSSRPDKIEVLQNSQENTCAPF